MIRNPPYVTDPEAVINLDFSQDLDPTSKCIEPRTVIDVFRETVLNHGSRPALLWKTIPEQVFINK